MWTCTRLKTYLHSSLVAICTCSKAQNVKHQGTIWLSAEAKRVGLVMHVTCPHMATWVARPRGKAKAKPKGENQKLGFGARVCIIPKP